MQGVDKLFAEYKERRARDAARYAEADDDLCMLCFAYGADKRSLFISCLYAIYEVVPEAIDLAGMADEQLRSRGYFVRICKSCRGRLLGHLQQWRNECVALRDLSKDHDGCIEDTDPERNIAVRVNGTTVMMTADEFTRHQERRSK